MKRVRTRRTKGTLMAVLFTADTHFGHPGALGLYRRPFASVAEMDAAMIERWNQVVRPTDEVWHLGDFSVRQNSNRVAELLGNLNGTKHLIAGNNDDATVIGSSGWESVQLYCEALVEDVHLVLCHYPFRTWRNMGKGWIDLHGHSHGRLKPQGRQCDVGVDAWQFRPVDIAAIVEHVSRRNARGQNRR
jgi:calcineurin-like phosphoesterase family protein